MSSLYELTQEALELYNPPVNEETGEILEDAYLAIVENANALEKKMDSYVEVKKMIDSDIDAIDKEIKRLQALKSHRNNNLSRLLNALTDALRALGREEMQTPLNKLKIVKNPPAVSVIDESKIPDKFNKIKYELDKTAIKDALKNGESVPGAELTQAERLKIS